MGEEKKKLLNLKLYQKKNLQTKNYKIHGEK